ncbi:MAG: 4-hydroxythreonine-4-phosphate dehydrogenase PdxA [Rhodanobacteraceae bacterium]
MSRELPRLAVTAGEPAGIGPELVVRLAASSIQADFVACTEPGLLRRAARRCGVELILDEDDGTRISHRQEGHLRVRQVDLRVLETPGQLDRRNAFFVLDTLAQATDACLDGQFAGMVTAPVHKGVINDAGEPFSGHTELLARRAQADVVMMLMSDTLRVALATTHLPLARVPDAINRDLLEQKLRIVDSEMRHRFGISKPRIAVLGLNPHAGEGGHLGREEIEIIEPALAELRHQGMQLVGPLPADTAFTQPVRESYDAVLAMYHDQALPVLKAEAFDRAINITLGLPFIRTSVDHGTALDLAGTNRASAKSMLAAAEWAARLASNHMPA